ncbi:MAG TPA: ABC transporter ATP-binding protein [Acidimicrobiales bacterium]|nr:ABC transporter ATP-binding protein [Acidimicrobiales bacterium]
MTEPQTEPYVVTGDEKAAKGSKRRQVEVVESEDPNAPLLEVRDLSVEFTTDDGIVKAVQNVSYTLHAKETLGIVGESGSGKTVTSMAILGLLPKRRAKITGDVLFRGRSIIGLPDKQLAAIRGKRIAMVFQDALAALNPVLRVGDQIAEAIAVHTDEQVATTDDRVVHLLDLVGIPNPRDRATQYPHEYSGGMRQRAMIAMSIANDPDVIIADEPTTALDVTIQAQVLEVFERIQERTSSALLLITHDLGVVAGVTDRILVMYAGRQVETGTVDDVFYRPSHPYTQGLLASLPRLDQRREGGERQRLHRIKGQPPSLIFLPPGCAFAPRCPNAVAGTCDVERPALREVDRGHESACHFASELYEGSKEPVS